MQTRPGPGRRHARRPRAARPRRFYGGLFGWEAEDMPVGDGDYYSMMRVNGKDVAAISPQPQQQRDAGLPPAWSSYITVESADAAAESAKRLGATVHAPPFEVMEAGRMAVIQDPQGAFFIVWEPRRHIGAGFVNAPGALAWNELASTDLGTRPPHSTAICSGGRRSPSRAARSAIWW